MELSPNPTYVRLWLRFRFALEEYSVSLAEHLEIGQLKCLVGKMLKRESLAGLLIF